MLLCRSSAGVSGALAKPRSGSGWRTNRRPEPPRIDSGRPISARQIPHHQIGLVSSHFNYRPEDVSLAALIGAIVILSR